MNKQTYIPGFNWVWREVSQLKNQQRKSILFDIVIRDQRRCSDNNINQEADKIPSRFVFFCPFEKGAVFVVSRPVVGVELMSCCRGGGCRVRGVKHVFEDQGYVVLDGAFLITEIFLFEEIEPSLFFVDGFGAHVEGLVPG